MADQQFKQMLLVYMLLIIKDRPLSVDELDDTCETFLAKDFNDKIDFQVADALPRLLRWGLVVQYDQVSRLAAAMPPTVALNTWLVTRQARGRDHPSSAVGADEQIDQAVCTQCISHDRMTSIGSSS